MLRCHQVVKHEPKTYSDPEQVQRIASSNGAFDHLAVNYIATNPMGSGVVTHSSPPSQLRTASMIAAAKAAATAAHQDDSAQPVHKKDVNDRV